MQADPFVPGSSRRVAPIVVGESVQESAQYDDSTLSSLSPRAEALPPTRILIVDDEPTIANTLSLILEREGYETMAVYGGEAAVLAAEVFNPDVLLTDLMMPGVDGLTVAALLRRRQPRTRVVLFTGYLHMRDALEHRSRYHPSYLLLGKPLHPTELIMALRRWIR